MQLTAIPALVSAAPIDAMRLRLGLLFSLNSAAFLFERSRGVGARRVEPSLLFENREHGQRGIGLFAEHA